NPRMDVRLLITSKKEGRQQEVTVSAANQFVLGRGPASAALLDGPGISREHVAISVDRSEIFVTDLSVNGTWINGKRLAQHQKHRVEQEDVVEIPGYEFVFQVEDSAAQPDGVGGPSALQNSGPDNNPIPAPHERRPGFLTSFTLLDGVVVALALL